MSELTSQRQLLHASAVALDGRAVMLCGPSGSGKSSVALHLIAAHGARLISDDRLWLAPDTADETRSALCVAPHDNLAGLIECRGVGLLRMPYDEAARLALVVQLVARDAVPRLAEREVYTAFERHVPQLRLCGHDAATPLSIAYALKALRNGFADDAIYPL